MNKGSFAFYNTENFFDASQRSDRKKGDFAPGGKRRWTKNKYRNKVAKISEVLSQIGREETGEPPLIIGLAEIENKQILENLISSPSLRSFDYEGIIYDSLDDRGMNTALLYRKDRVKLISSKPCRTIFTDPEGSEEYTRDILYMQSEICETKWHIFCLHLPSRVKTRRNENFRLLILEGLRSEVEKIFDADPQARIVLLGDFNCAPDDADVRRILDVSSEKESGESTFYNPFIELSEKVGSSRYKGQWFLFDQILMSQSLLKDGELQPYLEVAAVFNPPSIRHPNLKAGGAPFRTYSGRKYLGGYSDHFPVYAIFNC